MAIPALASEYPWRVRYNVRNGTTNVPNLFRNVPRKRIHTGRGNARRLDSNVGSWIVGVDSRAVGVGVVVIMVNKNPRSPFGKQGWKMIGSLN
jgi:hypothetical protein